MRILLFLLLMLSFPLSYALASGDSFADPEDGWDGSLLGTEGVYGDVAAEPPLSRSVGAVLHRSRPTGVEAYPSGIPQSVCRRPETLDAMNYLMKFGFFIELDEGPGFGAAAIRVRLGSEVFGTDQRSRHMRDLLQRGFGFVIRLEKSKDTAACKTIFSDQRRYRFAHIVPHMLYFDPAADADSPEDSWVNSYSMPLRRVSTDVSNCLEPVTGIQSTHGLVSRLERDGYMAFSDGSEQLDLSDLPPLAAGRFYTVWLQAVCFTAGGLDGAGEELDGWHRHELDPRIGPVAPQACEGHYHPEGPVAVSTSNPSSCTGGSAGAVVSPGPLVYMAESFFTGDPGDPWDYGSSLGIPRQPGSRVVHTYYDWVHTSTSSDGDRCPASCTPHAHTRGFRSFYRHFVRGDLDHYKGLRPRVSAPLASQVKQYLAYQFNPRHGPVCVGSSGFKRPEGSPDRGPCASDSTLLKIPSGWPAEHFPVELGLTLEQQRERRRRARDFGGGRSIDPDYRNNGPWERSDYVRLPVGTMFSYKGGTGRKYFSYAALPGNAFGFRRGDYERVVPFEDPQEMVVKIGSPPRGVHGFAKRVQDTLPWSSWAVNHYPPEWNLVGMLRVPPAMRHVPWGGEGKRWWDGFYYAGECDLADRASRETGGCFAGSGYTPQSRIWLSSDYERLVYPYLPRFGHHRQKWLRDPGWHPDFHVHDPLINRHRPGNSPWDFRFHYLAKGQGSTVRPHYDFVLHSVEHITARSTLYVQPWQVVPIKQKVLVEDFWKAYNASRPGVGAQIFPFFYRGSIANNGASIPHGRRQPEYAVWEVLLPGDVFVYRTYSGVIKDFLGL